MNTIEYLREKNYVGDDSDIDTIREDFGNYGIKVSYTSEEENRKLIFSAVKQFRKNTDFDSVISECNGLVLRAKTWKILALPPRTFKNNVTVKTTNEQLSQYEIYKAFEGTMVTFYYDVVEDKWCMATARGIDVSDLYWGEHTWWDHFIDTIKEWMDISYFLNVLGGKSNRCYTFCYHSKDQHPFHKPNNNDIIFIQSYDIETGEISRESPFQEIRCQEKLDEEVTDIRQLFKRLPHAYRNFHKKGETNFGYILRWRDDSTITDDNASDAHLFLESRLLQCIRQLYYHGGLTYEANKNGIDRELYVVTSAFLNSNTHRIFLTLFPQYKTLFKELENISVKLMNQIIDIHTNRHTRKEYPDLFESYSYSLYDSITEKFTLKIKNFKKLKKFILGLILVPENTVAFCQIRRFLNTEETQSDKEKCTSMTETREGDMPSQ